MRFREAVFAEAQDLLEYLQSEFLLIAALAHALDQAPLEMLQPALALPRSHRAAHLVRFSRREPGGYHGKPHHLLLEDGYAQRALKHIPHLLAREGHRLQTFAAAQIRMHHAA